MKLTREEILLEEYKNCTQVLSQANSLMWTRYSIFLAVNSGLITVWGVLWSYLSDKAGPLAIAPIGAVMATAWVFVSARGQGFNDLWFKRLREIECAREFLSVITTFSEIREIEFWLSKSYWSRRRVRFWSLLPPLGFIVIWVLLFYYGWTVVPLPSENLLYFAAAIILGFLISCTKDKTWNRRKETERLNELKNQNKLKNERQDEKQTDNRKGKGKRRV